MNIHKVANFQSHLKIFTSSDKLLTHSVFTNTVSNYRFIVTDTTVFQVIKHTVVHS